MDRTKSFTPAPIVLFVYNRAEHTKQTIDALLENPLAASSRLFIYSDGPKSQKDGKKVEKVRTYIRSIKGFLDVEIIERKKNVGLAENIVLGVTDIIHRYKKVIVLEDDIITSPLFLEFMNASLRHFERFENVMHVSAYMYPVRDTGLNDAFFLRPTSCWGWGTWDRAWIFFDKNPEKLKKTFTRKMIRDFNLSGAYDYWRQVILNSCGKLDTWAVFWYASVFLRGGLSLHPQYSFTKNIGHDESGIHSKTTHAFDTDLSLAKIPDFDSIRPIIDEKAENALKKYFRSIKMPVHGKMLSTIRRIRYAFFSAH